MTIIQSVLETGFFFSVEMSWHKLCAEIPDFIYDRLEISSIEAKMFFFFFSKSAKQLYSLLLLKQF